MRIAHLITRLVAGGAQKNTLMCAAQQQQAGHEVLVVSGLEQSSEGSLLEEARAAAYEFIALPYLRREVSPRADLLALIEMVRILRRWRPDICHTHTSKAGILGRIAARMVGVPVIVHTPHGHVFQGYFSGWKTRVFTILERVLATVATDAMVMLTATELREHLQEGVRAPLMVVIPSGVDLSRFRLESGPVVERSSIPLLGYVGRLADIKGPQDLVRAMVHIPDAHLLLVGDGPSRQEVSFLIEQLGLGERVQLCGWQTDVRPFLEKLDMLVVPSRNEGMGRVVVEAMAAGLPIVASAVGGLVDLVIPGVTGELCEAANPECLAEAVQKVLRLPDRGRSLGQQGAARAQDYSDEVMYSRLEALYERLSRLKPKL